MRVNRIVLALFFLIISLPVPEAFSVEEPIDLFSYDQTEGNIPHNDVVIQSEPEIQEPQVNLRPAGFKEYMYDTGIWYGVQWGARLYWVRDKSRKIFDTSFSKWWDNITTKPV